MSEQKLMNPLRKLEQEVAQAKNVKDILKVDLLAQRYIANYEAISGRKDGKTRFEREAFAFIDLVNNKPEIMECDGFSIMAGFIKAGALGCSFTDGKLSVYPRGLKQKDGSYKKILTVEPDAHGKREMLERMSTIKKVDEAVVVFKGDVFVYNPKKKTVTQHEQQWPVPKASKENVIGAYSTIHFSDGHTEDILISIHEIEIARGKSKMQDGGQLWKDHYGEACKKTVYNRAFKVLHKLPDTVITFPQFEAEEETQDVSYKPVNEETFIPETEVEVITPTEEVKEEKPKKEPKKTAPEAQTSDSFLD